MRYELHRGNCLTVMPELKIRPNLILTDPPYGISNNSNADGISNEYSGYTSNKGIWDKEVSARDWVPLACNMLVDGGIFACFGTFGSLVPIYNELEFLQMKFQSHITWHKTNPAPSIHRRMLTHANEIILVYSKGPNWTFNYDVAKELNDGKQMHNHFEQGAVPKMYGVTRKPVPLCEKLVKIFSKEGDTVFDPFAGSGAILEATVLCNRKAVGIEINPELWSSVDDRINLLAGQWT